MKKIIFLLLIAATVFTSCQKEIDDTITTPPGTGGDNNGGGGTNGGNTKNALIGTWDFISMDVKTQGATEFSYTGIVEKAVSVLDYITTDNSGTIIFDDSTMTSKDVTYTVSGTTKTYTYENGVLIDSLETLFSSTLPITDETKKYTLVSSDSIYFPEGGFSTVSNSSVVSEPSGAKLNFDGNSLTLKQTIYKDSVENVAGIIYQISEFAQASILLKKK